MKKAMKAMKKAMKDFEQRAMAETKKRINGLHVKWALNPFVVQGNAIRQVEQMLIPI